MPIRHVTYKPSKIVIGYGSAILAAVLFWFCLHTSKTGTLYSKSNRPFVVSVLDSRIHFHPACTTNWVYEIYKKILLSHIDKCNTGRDYCPGNVLFRDLSILLLPTHLFWPMEKRYFQYCLHSLSSKRE